MSDNNSDLLVIDGGVLEGGGQILRMAVAFSALLKKPVKVHNIRAGRAKGGLRAQHLSGINLVRDVCNGDLIGGKIGSTEITFRPGVIDGGHYKAEVETAGSVGLLMQIAFPCLLFAKNVSSLLLGGGTDADFAPPIDFSRMVFKPIAEKFGIKSDIHLIKRGFFPKGGGRIQVHVEPVITLKPIEMVERGELTRIVGVSFVSGAFNLQMSHVMADTAKLTIQQQYGEVDIVIDRVKEPMDMALGSGNGIILIGQTTTGCLISGTGLGRKGARAEVAGDEAANMLMDNLKHGGCVDDHIQDQLIILMALADGVSRIRCGPVTLHTETAIHIAHLMTKAKFKITKEDPKSTNSIIECIGQGHRV